MISKKYDYNYNYNYTHYHTSAQTPTTTHAADTRTKKMCLNVSCVFCFSCNVCVFLFSFSSFFQNEDDRQFYTVKPARPGTTTRRAVALVLPPPCLGGGARRVGPGQYQQYTRADFGQEAVGGATPRPQKTDEKQQVLRTQAHQAG